MLRKHLRGLALHVHNPVKSSFTSLLSTLISAKMHDVESCNFMCSKSKAASDVHDNDVGPHFKAQCARHKWKASQLELG